MLYLCAFFYFKNLSQNRAGTVAINWDGGGLSTDDSRLTTLDAILNRAGTVAKKKGMESIPFLHTLDTDWFYLTSASDLVIIPFVVLILIKYMPDARSLQSISIEYLPTFCDLSISRFTILPVTS